MDIYQQLSKKFAIIMPHLNEKQRRLLLAAEAKMIGWGGVSTVAKASGISRVTVHKNCKGYFLTLPNGLSLVLCALYSRRTW